MRKLTNDGLVELELEETEESRVMHFAYIREISRDEASALVDLSRETGLAPDTRLYAVRTGEGAVVGITDSWSAAWWTAVSNDLAPVSIH